LTTTLLAVDDSKTLRKVLEITFAGEDYRVVPAESSAGALDKLRAERPTVAVVDARLGEESGYDLCQKIKAESPNTRVLILSSKHHAYDKSRGATTGADDFIDKPFDTQQLLDKVAGLVRKAAEAPVAVAAPPPTATPYRTAAPAQVEPSPPAPPVAATAPRSPATLQFGAAAPITQPAAGVPAQPRPAVPAAQPPAATPITAVQVPVPREAAPAPARAPAAAPAPAPTPAPAPAARPLAPAPAASPAVAAVAAGNGQFAERLADLGLTREQVEGVLAISREVIEKVVWEVVPELAETMIKEEIRRLTAG
jgi:DNA-binding response OmpR family regulator